MKNQSYRLPNQVNKEAHAPEKAGKTGKISHTDCRINQENSQNTHQKPEKLVIRIGRHARIFRKLQAFKGLKINISDRNRRN